MSSQSFTDLVRVRRSSIEHHWAADIDKFWSVGAVPHGEAYQFVWFLTRPAAGGAHAAVLLAGIQAEMKVLTMSSAPANLVSQLVNPVLVDPWSITVNYLESGAFGL